MPGPWHNSCGQYKDNKKSYKNVLVIKKMSITGNRQSSTERAAGACQVYSRQATKPTLDEEPVHARIRPDRWRRMGTQFKSKGLRRRLLLWGLSLFGLALFTIVVASYLYMVQQIRQDAAALQSELSSATAVQIRNF